MPKGDRRDISLLTITRCLREIMGAECVWQGTSLIDEVVARIGLSQSTVFSGLKALQSLGVVTRRPLRVPNRSYMGRHLNEWRLLKPDAEFEKVKGFWRVKD